MNLLKILQARYQQGYRTTSYPKEPPTLPDRFRGLPNIETALCPETCRECSAACPTDAIGISPAVGGKGKVQIDLGRCLFCMECSKACPQGAIHYTPEYRLAVRHRQDLIVGEKELALASALDEKMRKLLGRSLRLRQVSAGGCNACEADVKVLETVVFDLGRFGIQFVASPRHADGLLITGPVTHTMKLALKKTYDAVPDPKIVIAVGACAISGGPFANLPEQNNGADSLLPVDLYIPGCPPHPFTILDGLLRLLGRVEMKAAL